MSTKPFKKVISEENQKKSTARGTTVKPFKVNVKEQMDTDEEIDSIQNILQNNDITAKTSKTNFFSTFYGIVVAFSIFVIIIVLADTIDTLSRILVDGTVSDYVYMSGISLLLLVLILNILSNIKQLQYIKNAKNIKEKFALQKENPTADIIPLANTILNHYSKSNNTHIIQSIKEIREELNSSQIYEEIYKDLDSRLLPILDAKAEAVIHKASMQAALSTAISPSPLIDMLLIIWRSFYITKEVSKIYGYRPGGLTALILLKKAMFNVAFAGITELASELTNEATGSTIFSKISQSSGVGIANGILLARLGYGVLEACRPIQREKKRKSFLKAFILSIAKVFKSNEKKVSSTG